MVIDKKVPVVLYGAGVNARKAFEKIKNQGLVPVCFCDRDKQKQESLCCGIPVLTIEKAMEIYCHFYIYIVAQNTIIRSEIINSIYKLGIDKIIIDFNNSLAVVKIKSTVEKTDNRYTLFLENEEKFNEKATMDYLSDEKLEIKYIERGIILPLRVTHNKHHTGGVCDRKGNFIDGHRVFRNAPNEHSLMFNHDILNAYSIPDYISYIDETVVYGGVTYNHYGHMIVEGLSRIWFHLENPNENYKYVFISNWSEDNIVYDEFYCLLGIKKENIILLKEPMQFKKVIVPEQSYYACGPYTEVAIKTFNAIRDAVKPANHEKVYFTKSRQKIKPSINEEYFEEYFKTNGYEIISPETLSVSEQISVMAGVNEFATAFGSSQHQILFSKNNIKTVIFTLDEHVCIPDLWINQLRCVDCTMISVGPSFADISIMNFIPRIFLPTQYWNDYLKYNHSNYSSDNLKVFKDFSFIFIKETIKTIIENPEFEKILEHKGFCLNGFLREVSAFLGNVQNDISSLN